MTSDASTDAPTLLISPKQHRREDDPRPTDTLTSYVWRMTGWHQAAACVMAIAVAALNLAPVELQRRIIDDAVSAGDVELLTTLGLIYASVFVGLRLLKFVLNCYQAWLAESAMRATRHRLAVVYCDRDPGGDDSRPGEAVSVINTETDNLGGFVGGAISGAVSNIAMLVGIVAYMLTVEPLIAAAALGFIVPQAILTPLVQRKLNRLTQERLGYLRDLGDKVAEHTICTGRPTTGLIERIYDNQMRFSLVKFALKGALNFLNGAGPMVVLLYGGWLVIQDQTTVGVLVAFLSGFERLASPIRSLIQFYREAQRATVQHGMIADWMRAPTSG